MKVCSAYYFPQGLIQILRKTFYVFLSANNMILSQSVPIQLVTSRVPTHTHTRTASSHPAPKHDGVGKVLLTYRTYVVVALYQFLTSRDGTICL